MAGLDWVAVGLNVFGMFSQLDAQDDLATLQEEDAARRAALSKGQASFAIDQHKKDTRRLKSAQRVAYASSGVTDRGSPETVARVTQEQANIEALAILWGGEVGADTAFFEGQIAGQAADIQTYTTILNTSNSIYNILK